jgi:hypothetical protein
MPMTTSRRKFVQGLAGGGAVLSLKYSPAFGEDSGTSKYRGFEDLYCDTCDFEKAGTGTARASA